MGTNKLPSYPLRMESELRERLKNAADKSGRSMNAEIVVRLEASFRDNKGTSVPSDLEAEINATLSAITNFESLLYRLHEQGKSDEDPFVIYAKQQKQSAICQLESLEMSYQDLLSVFVQQENNE